MYCPNCGVQVLAERKFCRSCGADFRAILLALTDQASMNKEADSLVESAHSLQNQKERVKRWGFITTWAGILLAACFITLSGILAVLNKPVSGLVGSMSGYGVVIALIGVGMMIYSRMLPVASSQHEASESKPTQRANTTGKLICEAYTEQMSNVTENTTELLGNYVADVEKRRRSGDLMA